MMVGVLTVAGNVDIDDSEIAPMTEKLAYTVAPSNKMNIKASMVRV